MQKIEAIINPEMLPAVQEALAEVGVTGMTVLEARGIGREQGYMQVYRGVESWEHALPKLKIELLVEEKQLEECINIIGDKARSGQIGDGKIYVSSLLKVVRIRTGEEGREAL